jgi:hypothetical protein
MPKVTNAGHVDSFWKELLIDNKLLDAHAEELCQPCRIHFTDTPLTGEYLVDGRPRHP